MHYDEKYQLPADIKELNTLEDDVVKRLAAACHREIDGMVETKKFSPNKAINTLMVAMNKDGNPKGRTTLWKYFHVVNWLIKHEAVWVEDVKFNQHWIASQIDDLTPADLAPGKYIRSYNGEKKEGARSMRTKAKDALTRNRTNEADARYEATKARGGWKIRLLDQADHWEVAGDEAEIVVADLT
jgi:hypothetical protein